MYLRIWTNTCTLIRKGENEEVQLSFVAVSECSQNQLLLLCIFIHSFILHVNNFFFFNNNNGQATPQFRETLSPVFSMHTLLIMYRQNNVLQKWRNWIFKHPQFCLQFFIHSHDIHVLTFSSAAGRNASSSVCSLGSEPVWGAILHSGLWRYHCSR